MFSEADVLTETPIRRHPTRSYGSYVGGRDVEGDRWVYTVSSRSLLEDVFTSERAARLCAHLSAGAPSSTSAG